MAAHPKRIKIAPEDLPVLEKLASSRVAERRQVDRAPTMAPPTRAGASEPA